MHLVSFSQALKRINKKKIEKETGCFEDVSYVKFVGGKEIRKGREGPKKDTRGTTTTTATECMCFAAKVRIDTYLGEPTSHGDHPNKQQQCSKNISERE